MHAHTSASRFLKDDGGPAGICHFAGNNPRFAIMLWDHRFTPQGQVSAASNKCQFGDSRARSMLAQGAATVNYQQFMIKDLQDLYQAEAEQERQLPQAAAEATNEALKTALEDHLNETRQHVCASARFSKCSVKHQVVREWSRPAFKGWCTNKLGIPGEDADGVFDGLEYLRTATLGLRVPGPRRASGSSSSAAASPRWTARRTSIRQGASEVTLVYRRDMKDMPAVERGPRGDRGRRDGHLPGRPGPDHHRQGRQGHGRRVHPQQARRTGRVRPPPAGAGPGHGVHAAGRPGAAGHRPGPRPRLDRAGQRGRHVARSSAGSRPTRSRSRRAGPASSGPATCGSAPRRSSRPSPRAGAPRTPSTRSSRASTSARSRPARQLAEPQPEFLSIVPFTSEVKEPRHRMHGDGGRGPQQELRRVRDPVHAGRRRRRVDPLPPVHLRGDRLLRPAPPRDRVRDDAPDARAAATTRGPATGA